MFVSKSTKRGFGECPQCWLSYFNRRKPPNCEKFVYHPGGTNESSRPPKKPKRNFPSAVFFVGSSHFSRKTSTKDDRCFVIKEGDSVFCSQQQCMDVRATFVSSGLAANSSCKHTDLFSDAVPSSFRRSICPPEKLRTTMETALHCLLYWGQTVPCLLSFKFQMCRLSFLVSPPPTILLVITT